MTNTTAAQTTATTAGVGGNDDDGFFITTCAAHGVKVVADFASHRAYVQMARDDDFGWVWEGGTITRTPEASAFDRAHGCDPWRCCERMVIDPGGFWDH